MSDKNYYYTAKNVSEILGVSESHAYRLIRDLNEHLREMGFISISGRIPKAFFHENFYLETRNHRDIEE